MPKPFYAEQAVVIDGETFRLAIDFEAIDATEQKCGGRNYDEILEEFQKKGASVGIKTKVLWGLLRKYHPDLSFDEILGLQAGDKNGLTMGLAVIEVLAAAFPVAAEAKGKNPRKPRGALKLS